MIKNLELSFFCVALLWGVYFAGIFLPLGIPHLGIRPRVISSLPGIAFSPFLHAGFRHLWSNSIALGPLLFASFMYSRQLAVRALIIIVLMGGAGIWLFGASHTVHIGASGIIFGLIGYLLAIGLFRRDILALFVSLIVAVYYGWALLSLFAVIPGVSWTGHFFGFIAGVMAAWSTRNHKAG